METDFEETCVSLRANKYISLYNSSIRETALSRTAERKIYQRRERIIIITFDYYKSSCIYKGSSARAVMFSRSLRRLAFAWKSR